MTLKELRKVLALMPESADENAVIMGDNQRNSLNCVVMSVDPINGTTIRLYGTPQTRPKGA